MSSSTNQLIHASRSGILAHLMDLDVVSNNLANINTIGFKRYRTNFQELVNESARTGVQSRSTQMNTQQGAIVLSSNPLDVAIQGSGFFAVTLPGSDQTAYTRDGQFRLDSERNIVSTNGCRLVWTGAVPEDAEEVRVDSDGTVVSRTGNAWTEIGNITLSRFANPSGLTLYGQNLYLATDVSGDATEGTPGTTGYGYLSGYALEQSNVNLAEEFAEMLTLQKAFTMSSKIFQQSDEMIAQAIRMRR